MTSLIELCLKASQSYVDEEDDVSPQIELVVYSILYVGSQTNWVLSSSDDQFLINLLASVPDSEVRGSIFKVVLTYDDEHVISTDSLNQIYNLPVDTYRHKSEEEQLEFQQSFLQLIKEDQRYDGEFVPTLKISIDGVPDYDDYINQIEDYAPDEVERIKLINQLLLNEEQQPFMYQALLHKYGIEDGSHENIWKTLMSKGYASIDQVIAPENLNLTIYDLNHVMTEASRGGHKEIVEMMIARGANNFNFAMVNAARGGHKEIVEIMIARGATLFDWTMVRAAKDGHKEIVEMTILQGATDFDLAMIEAAEEGHKEIVELMILQGATDFNHAMNGAAQGGHKEIVEMMISRGATTFDSAMIAAASGGHKEIVEMMIAHGATHFNETMATAARGGHKEIVEMMIARGVTNFDWTMFQATRGGHKEIVDMLQPYIN